MLSRLAIALACFIISAASSAGAQDAYLNASRDAARAQERQARELERLGTLERDRARAEDRARRNAERDGRSARRFDR